MRKYGFKGSAGLPARLLQRTCIDASHLWPLPAREAVTIAYFGIMSRKLFPSFQVPQPKVSMAEAGSKAKDVVS